MSTMWQWPGSRWWRVDLHTHSPASYDFEPEADRLAQNWTAWVAAAEASGLEAVALTDHNTPEGITHIQAAASAAGDLKIFPGVEVTVGGIHLLCLFDPKCCRDDVVALLSNLGIELSSFGSMNASSTKSILEAIEIAAEARAVVIAAHVNGPRGLLMLQSGDRLKALKAPGLIAAELAPMPETLVDRAQWLDPTSGDVLGWLDGKKTGGRILTKIWSSDSHSHAKAGRCSSWVKMTRPDIEGLRLALLDGEGSVKQHGASDPNRHADHIIESIQVSQAKYMGRPEAFTVHFNPWLNAIIGGRGTGKSTLVDLCRAAFRRDHELGESGKAVLRDAYDKRMRVPGARGEEGLLTASTLVEVVYRKGGERFVLSWDQQGGTVPVTQLVDNQRVPDQSNVRELFPVRIYSQKQLFDLAREPNALLTVIDDTDQVRGADLARLRKEAESTYLSLCAEVRALRTQAAELASRNAALADVRRKLEVLQKGGHAKVMNEYRVRQRQDSTWSSVEKAAVEAVTGVERAAQGLAVADLDLGASPETTDATAALTQVHEMARAIVSELKDRILDEVAKARSKLDALRTGANLAAWQAALAQSDHAYRQVAEQLADEGIANPDEYRNLLQRATALEQEISSLEHRKLTADLREQDARAELKRFRDLRRELTEKRTAFAEKTSGSLVKVEIEAYAGRPDPGRLREALDIAWFDDDYRALVERLPAADQPWTYEKLDRLIVLLREVVADPQKQWPTKDKRFETALRKLPPERLDRLALVVPDDAVQVSFQDLRDKSASWKKLAQGSPGQQTAALLAFVLGYGSEPIILDQPEDDLDSTLIYELVVQRLRDTKSTRQIIVVTHNANIVVHGDAELVVSLETRSSQTQIAFSGGLQEQEAREQICRVMEGGRDAFESRYHRIMHPGALRDG